MGGDDLGSDDEYLIASFTGADDDNDIDVDVDVEYEKKDNQKSLKRRRSTNDDDDDDDEENKHGNKIVGNNDEVKKSKDELSSKEERNAKKRIRVLGKNIRLETIESKSKILSDFAETDFQPEHVAKYNISINNNNLESDNFMDRLMCLISKKQLKIKQQQKSPRAVILCLSARRCVAVLKDLAPLKLRVAKLFPKGGTIDEHARQLESTVCGIAVGTPHRIKELIDRGSLSLSKNTQLFGLDTFENPKNFSVYTLPDTAPFVKILLKDHVRPVCCGGRKDLKIGFV
mmetsp:Transcript_13329/g.15042  ORF Transcript_13329/g.15042 Transcript_13329/m.15042 type:complete len:287 (+) Transcript_13329:52-912(+)